MKRISIVLFILVSIFFNCNVSFAQDMVHKPILIEGSEKIPVMHEQRDERYVKFLSASVKISVNGSAGSGTICYYDQESGFAYVISCGHLWNGDKSYDPKNMGEAKITIWYQNDVKLNEPKSYDAQVLFWSNQRGFDSSLVRFKPDWKPDYFPISSNFEVSKGMDLHSMGCDGGHEVARYGVRVKEYIRPDILTELNSPRPGRSGGGLLSDDELVGICWGTSDTVSGEGTGYFTPLDSIRVVFAKNKHEWLLNVKKRGYPVYDWDNPSRKYDMHFVPVPSIAF